ncbi:MAG: hypothetical protein HYZ61_00735 [Candidatus Andersenbacteria bacterium]|nr:hypothetical protein [Candidatus Andersenbacteria bacterium]
MRERLAQYYEAQQLVSDIRGDIEAAREILKQRGTDPDERIVAVKRYTVRCGHLLKQFQSMELHALAKQKLPSLEALSEELSNLTQSMVDFEEYRASQQKRKREKSARHEANRRQRAMETRFAATGSHLPKKKR